MGLTRRFLSVWFMILGIYLIVLFGIGNIAFTKQYFNDAETMVGDFLYIKQKYHEDGQVNENTDLLIDTLIEKSANNAGDLQELASQSFNIMLGALLAFLSASSTIIFQELQKVKASSEPEKGSKNGSKNDANNGLGNSENRENSESTNIDADDNTHDDDQKSAAKESVETKRD